MTGDDLYFLAFTGTDEEYYAASGMCGHCGNDPERCDCAGTCGCAQLHGGTS